MAVLLVSMLAGCSDSSGEERVRRAFDEKIEVVKAMFSAEGIAFDASYRVYFRAFKNEKTLELWVSETAGQAFSLLKTYDICQASGGFGPKRREGDRQVPEGFYQINRFNPASKFHLSMGLNYPNTSDLVFADREQPGSDIFIHGGCRSVGCLAMTDDVIKEIYLVASEAKRRGQSTIEVHIFPGKLSDENFEKLIADFPEHSNFWSRLKPGFDFFEKTKMLPRISVDSSGHYQVF